MYTEYLSPLGTLVLCSDGSVLTGLWLGECLPDTSRMERRDDLPVFAAVSRWLDAYFAGAPETVDFPVYADGTPFQRRVWEILLTIPYGQTMTYGTIARCLGENMSAQAVGQAVGRNPVSIIIPCHRVLGTGGKLTGYAGGPEYKKWLLTHEGSSFRK